jgi:glycosyltransferase involved in cell wall biosynthesis
MVSVIIPTFNRANFLLEAIDSVLAQTYAGEIEIIVIDDGSTDDTKDKLAPYQDKIEYAYIENGGPARARNTGMRKARGKYISFLDSDDLYYPYKIKLQADFLEDHADVDLVSSELTAIDDDCKVLDEFHLKNYHRTSFAMDGATYGQIYSKSISIADAGLNLKEWEDRRIYVGNVFDRYFEGLILSTNTVMFRRSVLDTIGFQHEPYWVFEDYEFILRIVKHHQAGFIDAPTYKLRYHADQISTTRDKSDGTEKLIIKHLNLIEIAERHGLNDEDYYSENKAAVDRKLGGLNKDFAVMLLKSGECTKLARKHLRGSAKHHRPSYMLMLLTITPSIFRRIYFKLESILDLLHLY